MMCKKQWTRAREIAVFVLGLVSFLFGLLSFLIVKPDGHSTNTLLGMFTGFGFGIMAVAAYKTIRQKVVSKEKLEQAMAFFATIPNVQAQEVSEHV